MRTVILLFLIKITYINCICKGYPNTFPIWQDELVLNSSTKNGQLYYSGSQGNQVPVLHVYGTPYEMGYAHGQLLSNGIKFLVNNYLEYFENEITNGLKVPQWVIDIIDDGGLKLALDLTIDATKPYTPDYFYEEIQGIADGSGIDFKDILRFHMLPELLKASCSMFGAWDKAVQDDSGETLLQLRALDWDTTSPLTLLPLIIVYHPESLGHTFMTLSFQGFTGAITGYSQFTGISEKVWANYNGTDNRFGQPFYFVLRDILQFDETVDQAINRIYSAHRTCAVYMGVGSNSSNTFTAVEYSYQVVRIFDDVTPFPIYSPQPSPHQLIPNIVYIDPDYYSAENECMTNLLLKNFGNITVDNTIEIISLLQTGNLHAAIYNYKENSFTFSVASHNQSWPLSQPPQMAYNSQFIKLNVTSLFNQKSSF